MAKRHQEGLEHKSVVTAGVAFAGRMKQVRARKGWTQAELADRLAKAGYPIDRVTLSKIESGGVRSKNVRLEEALAISYVLGVSPKYLLAPYGTEARVEVVPALRPSHPDVVRNWIAGQWTLADEDVAFFDTEAPPEEIRRLREAAYSGQFVGVRPTHEAIQERDNIDREAS